MKSASKTTAVLALSLLVFPGSGHFVLARPWRGMLWAGVFGAILLLLVILFASNVGKFFDGMLSTTGDVPFDPQVLLRFGVLGLASFVVWGLAGLDAFLLARSWTAPEGEGTGVKPAAPQPPAPPPPPQF